MGIKALALGATLAALVGCGHGQEAYSVPLQRCVDIPSCGSLCYDARHPETRADYETFVLSTLEGNVQPLYKGESIQLGKCLLKLVEGDESSVTLTPTPRL